MRVKGLAFIDGEYRVYLDGSIYGANQSSSNPNDLDFIRLSGSSNLIDVITSPDSQQVYGISNNTIYFNLR